MEEKHVVEEVPGELKLFSDGSMERTAPQTPLAQSIPPSNHNFVDGVATRDVVLDEATGLWARIYLPEKSNTKTEEKLPLVIHFHGGGFCVGHVDWRAFYYFYSRLARALHVVVVSVDYRLAPEDRLPAACYDCLATVEWVRSLAHLTRTKDQEVTESELTKYWVSESVDFQRCFLMGESAGGNLVHQTALACAAAAAESDNSPVWSYGVQSNAQASDSKFCLRGCILIHPGFVRNEQSRSEVDIVPKSLSITIEMTDGFLKLALPEGSNKDHPITNPMGAPPLHGLKLPKMLVAIADGDLMRDTQMEFCQAMINAGQTVETIASENVEHCFHTAEFAIAEDAQTAAQASNLVEVIDCFIKHC